MKVELKSPIKVIVGLGNPGQKYANTRHNIGFKIIDALAEHFGASWQKKENYEIATINSAFAKAPADRPERVEGSQNEKILLIKPQTFMNSSGTVIPMLLKQGIKADNALVVHDELELPFGTLKFKHDGSSKGHNGLKSLIAAWGSNFLRLRFGIGRPDDQAEVPDYVLQNFKENSAAIEEKITAATQLIIELLYSS
jgi:PTH1 family peptidyl-tRNA hydrolase